MHLGWSNSVLIHFLFLYTVNWNPNVALKALSDSLSWHLKFVSVKVTDYGGRYKELDIGEAYIYFSGSDPLFIFSLNREIFIYVILSLFLKCYWDNLQKKTYPGLIHHKDDFKL